MTVRLKKAVLKLLDSERVARVATAGARGVPHVVPVCHAVADGMICNHRGTDA